MMTKKIFISMLAVMFILCLCSVGSLEAQTLHLTGSDGGTRLHIEETGAPIYYTTQLLRLESSSQPRMTMVNNAGFYTWHQQVNTADGSYSWIVPGSIAVPMNLDTSGNLVIAGSLTTAVSFVPDYVFDPVYDLMPLEDLEAFIKKERHLPNVPSAGEVAENGLNVSEMQLRLLEKVEELTLYTIELQKKVKEQEARLEQLAQAR